MRIHRSVLIPALLAAWLLVGFVQRTEDQYFAIAKNLDIFGKVLKEVHLNYVDPVETNAFVGVGLNAMLGSLDPYTNYISAAEVESYRFESTGEYGGIGAQVQVRDGAVVILAPYENQPADQAGLRAGDTIVQINDEPVDGTRFSQSDIGNLLRGEANQAVVLKIKRVGNASPQTVTVVRDKVKVGSVPYAGYVADGIGYLTLRRFTQGAANEIRDAVIKLREENPDLTGLVFDLRDNPGGLLYEAIAISNLFIPKGELVVSTRGRMEGSEQTYQTSDSPFLPNLPVAVLINGNSASASEIVAGVLQDYDRGVVLGGRSFGKGLVQQTRPLSYNNTIKLTTARYYTPSGRCIQAIDYAHRGTSGEVIRATDDDRTQFKTRGGRPVRDQGGIDPDVPVLDTTLHPVIRALAQEHLFFDFSLQYVQANPTYPKPEAFELPDAAWQAFLAFLRQKEFSYTSSAHSALDSLEAQLATRPYHTADDVTAALEALESRIRTEEANALIDHQTRVRNMLELEIAQRYGYERRRIP